mmetsp:Transcript_16288/g.45079  ORF Transcript_16288/g.45079 Transcript_16288/m.45079 type:complete len:486 (-) Transcript_16288:355-1812(-)
MTPVTSMTAEQYAYPSFPYSDSMGSERGNGNSHGNDHRVQSCSPSGQKRALHHCPSNRNRSLATAAAVALLCFSVTSQQSLHVLGSSKHVPPPSRGRGFLGMRSSSSARGASSSSNNNHNNNNNPRSLQQRHSAARSSSLLRFSTAPDEEPEFPPASSYNRTGLPASSSSTSTYIGGKGTEGNYDDETRVTTTSFFELPSESPQQQEPQELPPGVGSSGRRPVFSFRRDAALSPTTSKQLKPSQIQNRFVWSLMAVAGFVEGFCIRNYGCFPNLMTGTILKLAEAVGSLKLSAAGFYASMVMAYMAGGSIVGLWKSSSQNSNNNAKRGLLEGVSLFSSIVFVVSDLAPASGALRLPLLATAFGIVNAGTMDAGAGVTNAMTGHVSKIGQGLVLATQGNGKGKGISTSANGMGIFWSAAVLANLVCVLLESAAGGGHVHSLARAVQWLSAKIPMGTTLAVVYGALFRWYLGASEKAAAAAAADARA